MNKVEVRSATYRVNISKGLGKLEVLDPEGGFCTQGYLSAPQMCHSDIPNIVSKHRINHQSGKLQVLDPKEKVVIYPTESTSRPRSCEGRQGSAGRKCYTPTKQISLCAVKPLPQSHNFTECIPPRTMDTTIIPSKSMAEKNDEKGTTRSVSQSIPNQKIDDKPEESSDEDDSSEENEGAPLQLLAEFFKAITDEDYQLAHKLCQMILIYEPENQQAKQFSPLIEEMLQIENEEETEDEDSEESDNEDSEETDNEDSSDSDESDDSSAGTSEDPSEDDTNK
ncbi:glutamate-rich protein 2 [Rhinophrynus dorsalis]